MNILSNTSLAKFKDYECIMKRCNNDSCKCMAKDFLELLSSLDTADVIKETILRSLDDQSLSSLMKSDIVQFSTFENSTVKLSEHIHYNGNNGYSFFDIGVFLLGNDKSKAALVKYGENHSKTGESLGLLEIDRSTRPFKVYNSRIGEYIIKENSLNSDKVIAALILNIKIIRYIIRQSYLGKVSVPQVISFLKETTKNRRLTNIKSLLTYLYEHSETNLDFLYKDIIYHEL